MPFLSALWSQLQHPRLVFITVAWLMVLLILGTVAQKYVGLYTATETFFYSLIWWVGPVPLPGGLTTLIMLTAGLMAKTCDRRFWSWARLGSLTAHVGALLLMLGGLVTFVGAKEGSMALYEGDQFGHFTAYHQRQLVVEDAASGKIILAVPFEDMRVGKTITVPDLGLRLTPRQLCRNCAFAERDTSKQDPDLRGRAAMFTMQSMPPELQDEANHAGMMIDIRGSDSGDRDGIHLTTDLIAASPWVKVNDQTINIALRKERYPLPFKVELLKFHKETHPGTDTARLYRSDVMIHEPDGTTWPAQITMNNPLRYRGYTLYQASFMQDEGRQGSVLAVVHNVGRLYPYVASILMSLGLILHVLMMIRARRAVLILVGLMGFSSSAAWAATPPVWPVQAIAELPILDHGRLKPLDTFARSTLELLSGRDHVGDQSALSWLQKLLMTPETVHDTPVFWIRNDAVRQALNLPDGAGNRYSAATLIPAVDATRALWEPYLTKDRATLSLPQRQMVELLENLNLYLELVDTLAPLRRDIVITDPELAHQLKFKAGEKLSVHDLKTHAPTLKKLMTRLAARAQKKNPDDIMSTYDRELVMIVTRMERVDRKPALQIFRVIPPGGTDDTWHTPTWVAMQPSRDVTPVQRQVYQGWQALLRSYEDQDVTAWAQAARDLTTLIAPLTSTHSLSLEVLYHQFDMFHLSLWFYCVGLLAALAWMMGLKARAASMATTACLGAAMVLHTAGLIVRVLITERPPVTNLYDSIIFVGWTAVLVALILGLRRCDPIFMVVAALCGVMLQTVGLSFDAEGDTMRVLMAVLDTNFWLSTHVIVITLGYGVCLVAAILAHVLMIQKVIRKNQPSSSTMHVLVLTALFLTTLGTILGGIWADQSWGRFWGWDPKENGALLIVLWIIWVLHGRLAGMVRDVTYLALTAYLAVIVALAWFGVNLLGVGLHSYGFTQSAMVGFVTFVAVDTVLIATLWAMIKLQGRRV